MENTGKVKEPTSKLSSENNYLIIKNKGNPREIIPLIRRALEAPSELRHPPMSEQRLSFE